MIMSLPGEDRLAILLQEAESLPPPLRLRLARQLLESLESSGWSAERVMDHFHTSNPPPDDATVRQWIDEHREEKYGK